MTNKQSPIKPVTLQSRQIFLEKIELNSRIEGLSSTRCRDCANAIFQAKVNEFTEPEYIIPSERHTARQKNSKYTVTCLALNRSLEIGQVSECELFVSLLPEDEEDAAEKRKTDTEPRELDFRRW